MHSVGFGRLSVSIDGELEQTLLHATVRAHLKIFLAEVEQRGSTGFVHFLTLSPEKRGVPPPSARSRSGDGLGESGSEKPRIAVFGDRFALMYSVFRKVQSHGETCRKDGK